MPAILRWMIEGCLLWQQQRLGTCAAIAADFSAGQPMAVNRRASSSRFKGYFIDELRIPLGRFRIPPAELSEMLPQQLLMLLVAADAFEDAEGEAEVVRHLRHARTVVEIAARADEARNRRQQSSR